MPLIRRARSLIETHGHDSKTALLVNCASLEQEAKGAECSSPGIVRRLLEMEKLRPSAAAAGDTRAVAFAIFQMNEITVPPPGSPLAQPHKAAESFTRFLHLA